MISIYMISIYMISVYMISIYMIFVYMIYHIDNQTPTASADSRQTCQEG